MTTLLDSVSVSDFVSGRAIDLRTQVTLASTNDSAWNNSVTLNYASPSLTLAGSLTVDGSNLQAGNRVLIKDAQSCSGGNAKNAAYNGIWVVDQVVDGTAILEYAPDWQVGSPVLGKYVYVASGTANNNSEWRVNSGTTVSEDGSANVGFVQTENLQYSSNNGTMSYWTANGTSQVNLPGSASSVLTSDADSNPQWVSVVKPSNGGTGVANLDTNTITLNGPFALNHKGLTIHTLGLNDAHLNVPSAGTLLNTLEDGLNNYGVAYHTPDANGFAVSTTTQGVQYQVLNSTGNSAPVFDALHLDQPAAVTGILPAVNGGTGWSGYQVGDILYADTNNTLAKLKAPSTASFLQIEPTSGVPSWVSQSTVTSGFDPKEACDFGTLTDVGGTYSSTAATDPSLNGASGTLTGVDLTNATVFDLASGTMAVGSRVLVKNQTDAKQNGIYSVTVAGSSGTMIRAADANGNLAGPGIANGTMSAGVFTFVNIGSTLGQTGWVVIGDGDITLNTGSVVWTQFNGTNGITAGYGIDINGNTVSTKNQLGGGINNAITGNYLDFTAGNAAIAGQLDVPHGGTGQSSFTQYSVLVGNAAGSLLASNVGTVGQALISGAGSATPEFGQLDVSLDANVVNKLRLHNGGTNSDETAFTSVGGVVYSNGTALISTLAGVSTGVLHGGPSPSFGSVDLTADVSGVLPSNNGGTGVDNGAYTITLGGNVSTASSLTTVGSSLTLTAPAPSSLTLPASGTVVNTSSTLTQYGVAYGALGDSSLTATAVGQTGQVLTGTTAGAPVWQDLNTIAVTSFKTSLSGLTPSSSSTGVVSLDGVLGITSGGTNSNVALRGVTDSVMLSNGLAIVESASPSQNSQALIGSPGTAAAFGALDISNTLNVANKLNLVNGGTNYNGYANAFGVMYYDQLTTSLMESNSGVAGNILISGGGSSAPAFGKLDLSTADANVSGALTVTNGGTGKNQFVGTNQLLVAGANATDPLSQVASGLSGQALISTGAGVPTFAQLNLSDSTNNVSGVLNVVNGGTGNSTLTKHSVLVGAGENAVTQVGPTAYSTLVQADSTADPYWSNSLYATTVLDPSNNHSTVATFTGVNSGVNHVDIANSVSGAATITATGSSDVDLSLIPSGTGVVNLPGATNPGELRFFQPGSSAYIGLKAATAGVVAETYTLPAVDGLAGWVLQTSGAGVMSWINPNTLVIPNFTSIFSGKAEANSTSVGTTALGYFTYASGMPTPSSWFLNYTATVPSTTRALTVQLIDAQTSTVYASDTITSGSLAQKRVAFTTVPSGPCTIAAFVTRSSGTGMNPTVYGIQIEFNA